MGKVVSGAVASSTAFTMPPTQDVKGKRRVVDAVAIEVATSPPPPAVVCALDTFSLSERLDALGTKLKNGASATGHGDRACALADELHRLRDELRETAQVIASSSSSAGQVRREVDEYPRVDDESVRPLVRQAVRVVRDIADLAGKELARTQESFWTSIKKACAGILFGILVSSGVAAAAGPMAAVALIAPVVCAALAVLGAVITVGAVGYRLYTAEKQRGERQKTLQEIQRHAGELLKQLRPADTSKVCQPHETGFSAGLADGNSRAVVSDGFFQLRLLAAGSNKARLRLAEDLLASDTPLMDEQRRSRADQIFGALDFNSLIADHAEVCMRLMPIASPDWQLRVFEALCRDAEAGVSSPGPRMPDVASPSLSVRFTRWVSRSYQVVKSCGLRRATQLTAEDRFAKQLRSVLDNTRSPFARVFRSQKALHRLALQISSDESLRNSGQAREWVEQMFGALDLTDVRDTAILRGWWKLARQTSPPLPGAFDQILTAYMRLGISVRFGGGYHIDLSSARLPLGEMLLDARFYLSDVTLSHEQLEGAVRDFSSQADFTEPELRRVFNRSDSSVLGAIDALPAEYHDYKVRLIEQCVGRLEATMMPRKDLSVRSELMAVVGEFLLKHPDYIRSSPQIQSFVERHHLVDQVLEHYQDKVLTAAAHGPEWLDAMLDGIDKGLNDSDRGRAQRFVRKHGCGIFQMLRLARTSTDGALLARVKGIHQRYLERLPDELSKAVATLAEVSCDDTLFPVLAGDNECALLLSDDYFGGCIGSCEMSWWAGAHVFDPAHVDPKATQAETQHIRRMMDIRTDLRAAPVLLERYRIEERIGGLGSGLKFLLPHDLASYAIEELHRTTGFAKWTQFAIQERLKTHIEPLVTFPETPAGRFESVRQREERDRMSVRLEEKTVARLLLPHEKLLLDEEGKLDPRKREYWCRCWAVTLMQMSGVFHFGEKDDSPYALRQLAAAFLNEAHAFGGQQRRLSDEEVANHRLAQQKLAGVGNVFTCANDLAVDIKNPLWEQANSDPQLKEIYHALIPRAW